MGGGGEDEHERRVSDSLTSEVVGNVVGNAVDNVVVGLRLSMALSASMMALCTLSANTSACSISDSSSSSWTKSRISVSNCFTVVSFSSRASLHCVSRVKSDPVRVVDSITS